MTPKIVPAFIGRNYRQGRNGGRILAIVDHIMEGSMAGTLEWFGAARDNPSSAHYGVGKDGTIVQYVKDEDTAWHSGKVVRPTSELYAEIGGNPNDWTIGIEHEGWSHEPATPAQIEASAELHALLSRRHGIPLDRRHVILHREIRADKTCPGQLPVEEIIAGAAALGSGGSPVVGERRWSPFFGEWVILTSYQSDDDWYFIRESELRGQGRRARTRWSDMPSAA